MQGYNLSGERLVTRRLSCSPEQPVVFDEPFYF